LWENLSVASPRSLDNSVSNEVMPYDEHSRDEVSSEFGGVIRRSGRMEESDQDHYFCSKM